MRIGDILIQVENGMIYAYEYHEARRLWEAHCQVCGLRFVARWGPSARGLMPRRCQACEDVAWPVREHHWAHRCAVTAMFARIYAHPRRKRWGLL